MPGALISGMRSYVATFWLGTRIRSSPAYGTSMPPLKKYVTCAYFSVSAVRSDVRPCSASVSATMRAIDCGANATGTVNVWSYDVMVATGTLACDVGKPSNAGSVSARTI